MIGRDGYTTLAVSLVVILLTGGLSLLWNYRTVYRVARDTPTAPEQSGVLMILGMRLEDGAVGPQFAARLDRGRTLFNAGHGQLLLLLGGHTGGNRCSEAEQGKQYLLAHGVPAAAILLEDASRHTLENLRNARDMLRSLAEERALILVTSRFHLARSGAMAEGLGLRYRLCAAEECLSLTPRILGRMATEAFFLHWYTVGKGWSTLTRNKASLERIS